MVVRNGNKKVTVSFTTFFFKKHVRIFCINCLQFLVETVSALQNCGLVRKLSLMFSWTKTLNIQYVCPIFLNLPSVSTISIFCHMFQVDGNFTTKASFEKMYLRLYYKQWERLWESEKGIYFVVLCRFQLDMRMSGFLSPDHAIFTINRLSYKSTFFGTLVVVTANIDQRDSNWQHSIGLKYPQVFFKKITKSHLSINCTHQSIEYQPDKNVTESAFLCVHHVPLFFCLSPLPAHRQGCWLIKQFPLYHSVVF